MSLSPFLNTQSPLPKPTGQLASPRYNPAIKNLENSFKLPPPPKRFIPPRLTLPKFPMSIKGPLVGNLLANLIINELLDPPPVADGTIPAHLRVPEAPKVIEPPTYPFKGGQAAVAYNVHYKRKFGFNSAQGSYTDPRHIVEPNAVYGPVEAIRVVIRDANTANAEWKWDIKAAGSPKNLYMPDTNSYESTRPGWFQLNREPAHYDFAEYVDMYLTRVDGQPDTNGDPPATEPPGYSPPGIYIGGPTYINYGSPAPPPPQPPPQPIIIYRPSPLPNNTTNPNSPTQPAPIGQPNPTPTGRPEPPVAPNPTTGPTPNPTNVPPAPLYGPWRNPTPTPTSKPGYNPGFTPTFTPTPIQPSAGFKPNPLPTGGQPFKPAGTERAPTPTPSPTPTPQPQPITPTPTTPTTPTIQNIWDETIKIGTGMVIVKQILDNVTRNTSPEAITTAAAAGTCRTTQPGGCTSNLIDNATNNINQNINNRANALDVANAAANAAQLGLLRVIDNKLGAQIPNIGIGGRLSNFVNWSVADRAMNLVTMFATLHNVMMLSNSVKETFLDVLDNLFQTGFNIAPSLFKKADSDEAIEAREYFGQILDNFFGSLFGVTEWTALKAQWKAFSTIYSSAAQAYNNLREIHNDSQELLNMARNYTAELGNALVDEGIISEDNWEHKDDKQKVKSKALGRLQRMGQGLEDLDNKLEAIEQVTATLLNITNTAKEIKENVEALDKGVQEFNKAAKERRDTEVEGLELPDFNLEDLF